VTGVSKKATSFPSAGMPAEEAEEFMALLLLAQQAGHNCRWCDYFKKARSPFEYAAAFTHN